MSNYSSPIAVDLGEAGQIYVSHEDVNGTGAVQIRWYDDTSEPDQVPKMAALHYDTVFRFIEVLLWAAMAARKVEQENDGTLNATGIVSTCFDIAKSRLESPEHLLYRRGKDGIEVWTPFSGSEGAWQPIETGIKRVDPPEES